jgi:hypothetical protein
MKLRGVPRRAFVLYLKVLIFVKGDEMVSQSFSDSQGRLKAREKIILGDCYSTSGPNVS